MINLSIYFQGGDKFNMAKKYSYTNGKTKLDMMNIIVFLVVALFSAAIGYYVGQNSVSPAQMREASMMLKDKGATMQTTGEMMTSWGKRYSNSDMIDKGNMMQEDGSRMMNYGSGMSVVGY